MLLFLFVAEPWGQMVKPIGIVDYVVLYWLVYILLWIRNGSNGKICVFLFFQFTFQLWSIKKFPFTAPEPARYRISFGSSIWFTLFHSIQWPVGLYLPAHAVFLIWLLVELSVLRYVILVIWSRQLVNMNVDQQIRRLGESGPNRVAGTRS